MMIGGWRRPVLPSMPCTSLPQMPQALTATMTESGRRAGSGASSRAKRLYSLRVRAFTRQLTLKLGLTGNEFFETDCPAGAERLRFGVDQPLDTIGIIAGNRSLPLAFAEQARAQGVKRLVAVAFDHETNPALAQKVDEIVWVKVGQLSKMIAAFKERGVTRCVMLGQIAPKNLFDVRPDMRALALLMKLKERNAHSIFGAIADELKKDGIELIEPVRWLRPLMPGAGFVLGPALTEAQKEDAAFGFRMAKEISRLEIGQTVVVKEGTVLAVEGFEGTDACLRRGGELAGGKGAWRSKWPRKSTTCALTFRAWARGRWRRARRRGFRCWCLKRRKRCSWKSRKRRRWLGNIRSRWRRGVPDPYPPPLLVSPKKQLLSPSARGPFGPAPLV
jgi:DUF1009 family protein